uniref:Uncharacterized protein n=1 Tax=Cafeteria roenbergensis TaxID=33653 RepID=A0A7S0JMP0_CAFRO|mmetsp:Transcript_10356/g.40275  ORF Transcript_10356/g.40275 Transcript_10356/m.40275 type:complete len:193 (+) Transcript_10356:960-1538(+)
MSGATADADRALAAATAAASEDSQFVEQVASAVAMLADDMATQAGALAVLEAAREDSHAELKRTQRALEVARQELHLCRVREAMLDQENQSLRRELELARAAAEEAERNSASASAAGPTGVAATRTPTSSRPVSGDTRGGARPMSAAAGLRLRASAVRLPPVGASRDGGGGAGHLGELSTSLRRGGPGGRRG